MKKKMVTALVAVSFLVSFAGMASAATYCSAVKVVKVGSKVGGTENFLRIQNLSGATCGGTANNATADLSFTEDKDLATLLTALSLGKNVGINTVGSLPAGDATPDVLTSVIVTQ
jgi:hypothetical protein